MIGEQSKKKQKGRSSKEARSKQARKGMIEICPPDFDTVWCNFIARLNSLPNCQST